MSDVYLLLKSLRDRKVLLRQKPQRTQKPQRVKFILKETLEPGLLSATFVCA